MFSVICVYNDAATLERRLLAGLTAQTEPHEVVAVDNRDSRFPSAATALNHGASQASGDWLVFAHQDVQLLSPEWLARARAFLSAAGAGGWYGVAGFTRPGRFRGILRDRAALSGAPFDAPAEVQTLDECLLIRRRAENGGPYFDEGVPGWHAYGVEACCAAARGGATNYVLPLPVWHDSKATNLAGLEEAHAYVWHKHGAALGRISTTCGDLPDFYGWGRDTRGGALKRIFERAQTSYYHRLAGHPAAFHHDYYETLESLTESEDLIECLHAPAWFEAVEAAAFVPHPARPRRVVHHFGGWDAGGSGCVVVAGDLIGHAGAGGLESLRRRARRVIVCVDWDGGAGGGARRWKELKRDAADVRLTRQWDGARNAILVLRA
jgi:hypothetical protein